MSELRSAIESFQADDLRAASDEQLEADFTELQQACQALEAERLRRLSEIHRRQSHRRDGYLTTASWLVDRHRLGWSAASREIRTARSLERMPRTKEALATGELTSSALHMLVWARQAHPAQFRQSEIPFGGWKESGLGRELGLAGLREYVAFKRVAFDTAPDFHLRTWFERLN